MLEIIMFWVWVTALCATSVYVLYFGFFYLAGMWLELLLSKAGFSDDALAKTMTGFVNLFNTRFKVLELKGLTTEIGFFTSTKLVLLVSGLLWHVFTIISVVNGEGSWAGLQIGYISSIATFMAGVTAWVAMPLIVVGGGSFLFIKGATVVRKITEKVNRVANRDAGINSGGGE